MDPKIKKIQYQKDYKYKITFEDGKRGTMDLEPYIWGEVFRKVKNKSYFQKAYIDPTTKTITWPNGADLAPETLYRQI